jgi:hypothetical protein
VPVAPSSTKTKRKIYLFISVDPGEERPPKGDPAKVDPVEENEPNPEEN